MRHDSNYRRTEFTTAQEAQDWMIERVGDECIDNIRFAFLDDQEELAKYNEQEANGCCGSWDMVITVNNRPATIGCNYGH